MASGNIYNLVNKSKCFKMSSHSHSVLISQSVTTDVTQYEGSPAQVVIWPGMLHLIDIMRK